MARNKKLGPIEFKRPFKIQYFFWGNSRLKRADTQGHCTDLREAYGNASRQLGRLNFFKAVIVDREQERIVATLTREQGRITIKEREQ